MPGAGGRATFPRARRAGRGRGRWAPSGRPGPPTGSRSGRAAGSGPRRGRSGGRSAGTRGVCPRAWQRSAARLLAPAGGAGTGPGGWSNLCARSLRPPCHRDGLRAAARAAESSRPPAGAHGTPPSSPRAAQTRWAGPPRGQMTGTSNPGRPLPRIGGPRSGALGQFSGWFCGAGPALGGGLPRGRRVSFPVLSLPSCPVAPLP